MIYHLPLAILRARWPRPASAVREWASAGAGVVVADAVTPDDLRRLARLIVEERLLGVATGSAGLADALGQAMSWRQKPLARISPSGRPILLVVGSANPTSLAQIVFLEEQELAAVIRVRIPAVLGEKKRVQREVDRVRHDAAAAIRSGQDAVLTLAQDEDRERPVRSRRTKVRAESPPALSSSASATLSDFLGRAAHDLTHSLRPGGLVLCGGDIAVATCRALGAKGVILGGEVQPGVPWGRLVGGERPNLPVVTKAGGFGRPDAFRAAIRFLKRPRAG